MGQILDGKKTAAAVLENVRTRSEALQKKGIKPGLATVLVGDDPASHVYVGQKIKKCQEFGVESIHRPLPGNVTQQQLMDTIAELNTNKKVHGIIVQLPLPAHLDSEKAVQAIDPKKDADGLHPHNQGLVNRLKTWSEIESSGIPLPCTPAGVIQLLLQYKIPVAGQHAVVVGRSTLVGKPVSQLLLSLDATVTMAHSRTKNLMAVCQTADILVAALGRSEAITANGIKPGAVVIDVGISRTPTGLKGDVNFAQAEPLAAWITPVPGGVGPMTVAMLLQNTVLAAEMSF